MFTAHIYHIYIPGRAQLLGELSEGTNEQLELWPRDATSDDEAQTAAAAAASSVATDPYGRGMLSVTLVSCEQRRQKRSTFSSFSLNILTASLRKTMK